MFKSKFRNYRKICVVVAGCGVVSAFLYAVGALFGPIKVLPYLSPFSRDHCLPHLQFRRDLASRLLKAVRDAQQGKTDTALSEIELVAAMLDNRYYLHSLTTSLPQPGYPPLPIQSSNAFHHTPNSSGPPPPNILANTTATTSIPATETTFPLPQLNLTSLQPGSPLRSLVTVLIDVCEDAPGGSRTEKTGRVVASIRRLWKGVKVVIGVEKGKRREVEQMHDGEDVLAVEVECDPWNHAPLPPLLEHVSSPYVLLLVSPLAVTPDLNITRLLTVSASMKGVGVVGVSERGIDAGWDYSCLQVRHKYSHLSILNGYEYSQSACVFCDVSSTSFLAATSVLESVHHDSSLPLPARRIDWALRLHLAGVLSMTCPDVMIHTTNKVVPNLQGGEGHLSCNPEDEKIKKTQLKMLYIKLAQKFELNSISFPNRTFLEYNCSEIQFECEARYRVPHFLLPPCCIKIKSKIMKSYNAFTKENLIPFKLNYGSLLAAVKFKNHIPWDFDDDVRFENAFYHLFKSKRDWMTRLGLSPRFEVFFYGVHRHNYIYLQSPEGFSFDLLGADLEGELSKTDLTDVPTNIPCLQYGFYATPIHQYLSDPSNVTHYVSSLKKDSSPDTLPSPTCYLFTLVRIGEDWVPSPINPGLQALKMYGDALFKHQIHWRFKDQFEAWPGCPIPDHPLCLNIYPTDGTVFLT